jgi:hypothetical protein
MDGENFTIETLKVIPEKGKSLGSLLLVHSVAKNNCGLIKNELRNNI